MSRSIVVVNEELMRFRWLPKTGRQTLQNQLSLVVHFKRLEVYFTTIHRFAGFRHSTCCYCAEVTVLDFIQPNVEIIDLPIGVSLEAILPKAPITTHSEGTKVAVCLHPWSWLGGRMENPWVIHTLRCLLTHSKRHSGRPLTFQGLPRPPIQFARRRQVDWPSVVH